MCWKMFEGGLGAREILKTAETAGAEIVRPNQLWILSESPAGKGAWIRSPDQSRPPCCSCGGARAER